MSLTSELKENQELSSLLENKLILKKIKVKDRKDIQYELQGNFKEAAIIGTAYDYLLRLNIEKRNKTNHKKIINSLIATNVYKYTKNTYPLININFTQVLEILNNYLDSKLKNKDINLFISSIIYCAFLDQIYRQNQFEFVLKVKDIKDIEKNFFKIHKDLKNLTKTLLELDSVFLEKNIITNPTFTNSKLIGGADADLIINNILIDIKTVTVADINIDMLKQLICYSILAELDGIKIDKIGIFFSRYNIIKIIDKNQIITEQNYKEIEYYFKKYYGFRRIK